MARSTQIELHGWDSRAGAWHGPDDLEYSLAGSRSLLNRLRELSGSWHGRLRAQVPCGPELSICATVRDLGDAGLGLLDVAGSFGGPMLSLLVVPAQRRGRLRPELAFEFVSFLRFLEGPAFEGAELKVHDYIERMIAETDGTRNLVFSVESRHSEDETHIAICEQAGRLATAMLAWMAEHDGAPDPRGLALDGHGAHRVHTAPTQ